MILSSAIDQRASIDEMNIAEDSFLLSVISDNPLDILSLLEKNKDIAQVSLEKLSREGISESATIRGVFADLKTEYVLPDNLKDKISYLEERIGEINNKREKSKWRSASLFLSDLKQSLEANGCLIKSFTSKNSDDSVLADITVETDSQSLFSFLKERGDAFSIQHLRIRRRTSSVQADIRAKGILSEIEKSEESFNRRDATKLFSDNKKDDSKKQEAAIRKTTQFSFVGKARKDGTTYCVFKNERSGKIHRLVLTENADKSGTCSVIENSRYIINIDNEKFEVGK